MRKASVLCPTWPTSQEIKPALMRSSRLIKIYLYIYIHNVCVFLLITSLLSFFKAYVEKFKYQSVMAEDALEFYLEFFPDLKEKNVHKTEGV